MACDKRAGMFETIAGLFWTAALLYAESLSHMRQNLVRAASTLRSRRHHRCRLQQKKRRPSRDRRLFFAVLSARARLSHTRVGQIA
jgi:hypothetical protein